MPMLNEPNVARDSALRPTSSVEWPSVLSDKRSKPMAVLS